MGGVHSLLIAVMECQNKLHAGLTQTHYIEYMPGLSYRGIEVVLRDSSRIGETASFNYWLALL
jgi:hypothetical protein